MMDEWVERRQSLMGGVDVHVCTLPAGKRAGGWCIACFCFQRGRPADID